MFWGLRLIYKTFFFSVVSPQKKGLCMSEERSETGRPSLEGGGAEVLVAMVEL